MKLKLLNATVIAGGVWPAGSVFTVGVGVMTEDEAVSLLKDGLAAEVKVESLESVPLSSDDDSAPNSPSSTDGQTPSSAQDDLGERKRKK